MPLKITDLRARLVGANGTNHLYLQVTTNHELRGIGEIAVGSQLHAALGAIQDLAPVLEGEDPLAVERIRQTLLILASQPGCTIPQGVLAGIEMALWDIKGKALGVPVHQFFGGRVRDRIRVCASGLSGNGAGQVASSARQLAEKGYTALKWCPIPAILPLGDRKRLDQLVGEVAAVRDAVGPSVDLILDCRGRLTSASTVLVAEAVQPFGVLFLADPISSLRTDALVRLSQRVRIPIGAGADCTDQRQFLRLLNGRACGVLLADPLACGGIYEVRKVASAAEVQYASVVICHSRGWVSAAAAAHLAATIPNLMFLELDLGALTPHAEILHQSPALQHGYLDIPEKPGLGIVLDLERIEGNPGVPAVMPLLHNPDGSPAGW